MTVVALWTLFFLPEIMAFPMSHIQTKLDKSITHIKSKESHWCLGPTCAKILSNVICKIWAEHLA